MTLRRVAVWVWLVIGLATCCHAGWAVSLREEIKIGAEASQEVEKQMPLCENKKWQDDITAMGQRLIVNVKRKEIPYHFRIVTDKDGMVNAFALPGGYVYFTERMWRLLTPDERAAVLAHEITHCDLRHGIDQTIKQQQRMLWTLPLIVLGGGGGAEAWMMGNWAVNARYSRICEREADEQGIQLLRKAGYNPGGAVTSMKKLLSIENDENRYEISAIFADHPDTVKRIDYLTKAAVSLGADPKKLDLPFVDDPARIGNIIRKVADMNALFARTSVPLDFNQRVIIKKILWDEEKQALEPKPIAEATVLTPGKLPTLVLNDNKDYHSSDVMVGDGVYPAYPALVK